MDQCLSASMFLGAFAFACNGEDRSLSAPCSVGIIFRRPPVVIARVTIPVAGMLLEIDLSEDSAADAAADLIDFVYRVTNNPPAGLAPANDQQRCIGHSCQDMSIGQRQDRNTVEDDQLIGLAKVVEQRPKLGGITDIEVVELPGSGNDQVG